MFQDLSKEYAIETLALHARVDELKAAVSAGQAAAGRYEEELACARRQVGNRL